MREVPVLHEPGELVGITGSGRGDQLVLRQAYALAVRVRRDMRLREGNGNAHPRPQAPGIFDPSASNHSTMPNPQLRGGKKRPPAEGNGPPQSEVGRRE